MCEAELWDEALVELKRQSYSPAVKKQETIWLARIYLGLEQYDRVLELADRARQDACDIRPSLAVAYARTGQQEQALRLAQEAVRVGRPGAEFALGQVYYEAGDYERALRWYERAARSLLARNEAMPAMGKTLMALGDYREARAVYAQVVRLRPFVRVEDLLQLAECLRHLGRNRQAAVMEQLAHEKA